MKRLAVWTVLFMAALQAQPPEGKKPSVAGSVLSITGEPLKKAQVTLRRVDQRAEAGYSTTTDAAGAFVLTDLEPGKYVLDVERRGYISRQYNRTGWGSATFPLAQGQALSGVVVKLVPQGVISGKVIDEDGDPFSQCIVQLLSQEYVRGKRRYQVVEEAQVNDLGEFRVANLAPGKYIVGVAVRNRPFGQVRTAGAKDAPEEGYTVTYYPSTTDPSQATPAIVAAGSDIRGMEIRMVRTRTYHVRGRVVDTVSNPLLRDICLSLTPADANGIFEVGANKTVVRDAAGTFDIGGVVPGSYILMLNGTNGSGTLNSQQPLEVSDQNVNDVVVLAKPGLHLSGSIIVDGKGPVDFSAMRFSLEPIAIRGGGSAPFQPKPDGTFTVADVGSAKLWLQLISMGESNYVASARLGSQDIPSFVVDLSGGAAAPLEIFVGGKAAQIRGTVRDARREPAPNATVVLVPESSRRDLWHLFKRTTADQNGAFTLKGIAPGEYTLFSWESIEYGAWQDPAVLLLYEVNGTKVKVEQGGIETAEVKMIPAADTK